MANKAIKFTEEEVQSLQNLQRTYQQITLAFGQLAVSKLALEERNSNLKNMLADTKNQENELAKSLTEKYGKGSLNIETGEFTPTEEASEETTE